MLATHGSVAKLTPIAGRSRASGTATGYWSTLITGIAAADAQRPRRDRRVSAMRALAADLADHHVILDGEVVALDESSGVPSFGEMQNRARSTRVEFWAFDILHLDGRSLLQAKYWDRREIAGNSRQGRGQIIVPSCCSATEPRRSCTLESTRFEGVVARKWDSGSVRAAVGVVDQGQALERTQEIVIGGWRAGEGGRSSGIGALVIGVPGDDGLDFAGRVGTGFTEKELPGSRTRSTPLDTKESPFNTRLTGRRCQRRHLRAPGDWWERSGSANGPVMAGCGNRVGGGCGRTSRRTRWCGSRAAARSTVGESF